MTAATSAFLIVLMMRMLHSTVKGFFERVVKFNAFFQHGHLIIGVARVDEGKHILDNAAIALQILCLGFVFLQTEQLVALFKAELVVFLNKFRLFCRSFVSSFIF